MIKQGDVHTYRDEEGKTLIKYKRIGKQDQVQDAKGTWIAIKPSLQNPNEKGRLQLLTILHDDDTVDDFICSMTEKMTRRGSPLPAEVEEDFPLTMTTDKNGHDLFKAKQVLFHAVEKIGKSNPQNTIAKGQYLTVFGKDEVRTLDITMPEFQDLIAAEAVKIKMDKGIHDAELLPSSSTVRENLTNISQYLKQICKVDPSSDVDIRLSARDGYVIYDTLENEVYKITADDISLVPMPNGLLRMPGMKPLGEVDLDAQPTDFRLLEPRMPFSLVGKAQHMAWLLTMAFERLEGAKTLMPIEIISGPQGTSKTTGAEVTLNAIDPNDMHVVSLPWNRAEELAINLSRNKFVIWDNMSGKIQDDVSNMMCTAVTGGNFEKRKLYSDNLVTKLPLRGKPIITTVGLNKINSDLQERVIYISAKKFEKPVSMVVVKRYMREHEPKIRGAYMKLMQHVLRDFSSRLDLVIDTDIQGRLVEYAAIGDIMMEQFGARRGLFIDAYKECLTQMKQEKAENDALAQQVLEYIRSSTIGLDLYEWEQGVTKSSKNWALGMNLHYGDKMITSYGWKRAIDNCADVLATLGVTVTSAKRSVDGAGNNYTIVYKQPKDQVLTAVDELEKYMGQGYR